jgi:hypothetical protein
MGLQRDCTRMLGLEGYRVAQIAWEAEGPRSRMRISIERAGSAAMNVPAVDAGRGAGGIPRNGRGTTCRVPSTRSPLRL